jgi:prophage antirepressor-like protein
MNIAKFQHFSYQGCNIRTTVDKTGCPWFLARDVCKVLAIANSRHALTRLDPDEKGVA